MSEPEDPQEDLFDSVTRVALLLLVFLSGSWVVLADSGVSAYFKESYANILSVYETLTQDKSPLLTEYVYPGDGVGQHDPQQAYAGLTILQGIFPGGLQVKLIDMDGNEINNWPLNFYDIWPNPTHISEAKRPKTPYDHHSQGILAQPDGSIILNFGYLGTAKLDKCGEVLWTVDRMTRHFVTPDGAGNYWIGANRNIEDIPDELLFFKITKEWLETTFQRYENTMLRVSPQGEILEEVSVLKPFYDAGLEGHVYSSLMIKNDDPTHHNNVELVTPELADKIEGVNPGDLLLSIRNMNMIIILDQDSYEMKWNYSGGWTQQHDPDITPEGNIVVFNNSREGYGFKRVKGSSLTQLDPATGELTIIYPQEGQPEFYTPIFGTHQKLPNGNIFISEGLSGRVFEINPQGETVWEYISRYDDTYASIVEEAHRYAPDYFTVEDWGCDGPQESAD